LRDAEERYALVSLASNEGLWDMGLSTDRFYMSPRVLSSFGFLSDSAGFRQEAWVAAIRPDDVRKYRVGGQEHLNGDRRIFDLEYRMLHSSGEQRWIPDWARALRDSTGLGYRIAGSVAQITARKRDEVEMSLAKDRAEIANRAKALFLVEVSYELGTPLKAIIGFSDFLTDDDKSRLSPEDETSFLQSIYQSGHDLLLIINDTLDMLRIDPGDLVLANRYRGSGGLCRRLHSQGFGTSRGQRLGGGGKSAGPSAWHQVCPWRRLGSVRA